MTSVEQDVSASCNDCTASYTPPTRENGSRPAPSAFVRKHIAETGHSVRVTRRKVTTYGPKEQHP